MLSVAHVVEDLSPANGGITSAVLELASLMHRQGIRNSILAAGRNSMEHVNSVLVESAPIASMGRMWRMSPGLRKSVEMAIDSGAIPHVHGLWMYPQWMVAMESAKRARPFIITPHNMLGGW